MVIYLARTPANVDVNMAEWRWNNDFGKNAFLYEPAHTDYTIYTQNGEVFKHVRNARDMNDNTPTVVTLPAGSYRDSARLPIQLVEATDQLTPTQSLSGTSLMAQTG
jgi:hypothetical protein